MENDTIVLINNNRLSENQLEKIFALRALKANPELLENVFSFEKLVYVLNGDKPNITMFDPPTILHIAKAIKILGECTYHPEIEKYIAALAFEEGWVKLPEVLSFAQDDLDELLNDVELDEDQLAMQNLKHKAVLKYLES